MSGEIKNNQSKDYQAIHIKQIREKVKAAALVVALIKRDGKEEEKEEESGD